MKIKDFESMCAKDKCETIWKWAYYLTHKKVGRKNTVIYFLNGFFVMVTMDTRNNEVIYVKALEISELDPMYFDLINSADHFLAFSGSVKSAMPEIAVAA